jgi:hypothetical protein
MTERESFRWLVEQTKGLLVIVRQIIDEYSAAEYAHCAEVTHTDHAVEQAESFLRVEEQADCGEDLRKIVREEIGIWMREQDQPTVSRTTTGEQPDRVEATEQQAVDREQQAMRDGTPSYEEVCETSAQRRIRIYELEKEVERWKGRWEKLKTLDLAPYKGGEIEKVLVRAMAAVEQQIPEREGESDDR